MAKLDWTQVRDFAILAANNFFGNDEPTRAVRAELDGPDVRNMGSYTRWNYGIPAHTLDSATIKGTTSDPVDLLCDWFKDHYKAKGALAKKLQAKEYGLQNHQGFVINLTMVGWWNGRKYVYNFHVKLDLASLDMTDLVGSGASDDLLAQAKDAMFPALGGSK